MNKSFRIIYLSFIFISLVAIIFYFLNKTENRGINLYIRNFTDREYILKVAFNNEKGIRMHDLQIPIVTQYATTSTFDITFNYSRKLDAKFEYFAMQCQLVSSPDGEILDERIVFWPGEAGSADGAASNRIAVEIGIIEKDRKPKIDLSGIL